MCVDLSLGFLFCSIDLYVCLCASTILSWWLWLCSRAWSQADWLLQFHSSFSRLLWLVESFCISIPIVKLFVLALWKNTTGSLIKGFHWICRLLWIVYSFSLYWFFRSMNMVFLHLLVSSLISFISVLYFLIYRCLVSLGRYITKYFILFIAMISGIFP